MWPASPACSDVDAALMLGIPNPRSLLLPGVARWNGWAEYHRQRRRIRKQADRANINRLHIRYPPPSRQIVQTVRTVPARRGVSPGRDAVPCTEDVHRGAEPNDTVSSSSSECILPIFMPTLLLVRIDLTEGDEINPIMIE